MNVDPLFQLLLELLLKSGAILVVALLTAQICRRASAATRHIIWLAAVCALLLLPLTKLAAPVWSYTWARPEPQLPQVRSAVAIPSVRIPSASEPVAGSEIAPVRWQLPTVSWPKFAFGVWLAGVFAIGLHRAGVRWWLSRLTQRSQVVPLERWSSLVSDVATGVEVRESAECRVPMATGVWRPIVLLPTAALQWNDQRLASALRHEFGHIRRRDCLSRLLVDLVCAIYWVNPLVGVAARSMRVLQEQACDDLVLNSGASAADYATQLVEVVRGLSPAGFATPHALAMAQPSTLETRVRAIVDDGRDRRSSSRAGFVMGATGAMFALMISSAAQLGAVEIAKKRGDVAAEANGPAILIETKFFDLDSSSPEVLTALPWLKDLLGKPAVAALQGVFTKEQGSDLVKALSAAKGVDLLTAPRVTTRSGQEAEIEIARELRYPTDWRKNEKTGDWEPVAFATKRHGVTLKVLPTVADAHIIDLQLHPTLVELSGFQDLDGSAPEVVHVDANDVLTGHRSLPVFSTRTINTSVSVFRGQSVLVQIGSAQDPVRGAIWREVGRDKRRVFALVSADVVEPEAKKSEPAKPQAVQPPPAVRAPSAITADKIAFDPAKGAVTASGDVKVETPEATLLAQNVEVQPKKPADAQAANPVEAKAKAIILPNVDLRDAPIRDAVSFLVAKSRALDPEGKGVNVALRLPETDTTTLTLNLENVPLSEAVRYVAELAGLKFEIRADGYLLLGDGKTTGMREPAEGSPEAALLNRARGIVIPQVVFKEALVREAVEFLRVRSGQLDLEKKQVNVVVQHSKTSTDARITLSLRSVSVAEALRYTAELAGLQLEVGPSAFVLRPPAE